MKKLLLFPILLVIAGSNAFTQNTTIIKGYIDSLKHELAVAKEDTTRVLIIAELAFQFSAPDFDSCRAYSKQGLALAQQLHFLRGEVRVLHALAGGLAVQGDLPKSLELLFSGLQIAEENHFPFETVICLTQICAGYWSLKDYPKAISYGKRARQIYSTLQDDPNLSYHLKNLIDINIGLCYSDMNLPDSAMIYLERVYKDSSDLLFHPVVLFILGDVYFKLGNHQKAFDYLYQSIEISDKTNDYYTGADACKIISVFFSQMNQTDSAIFYAKKGLASSQAIGYKLGVFENSKLLASQYEGKDLIASHFYLKMAMAENDEMYGAKKVQELQKTLAAEQERQRLIDAQRIVYENKIKQYAFLAGLGIMFFIAFFLYRNNRQKQKANSLLAQQKQKVESTLTKLKATQAQLIHSEKMASLGELTAGIAHEIQNPLNFVNNFSEVNKELLSEMKDEIDKGNIDEVKTIANDIIDNEKKINHHGKRAEAIVKGMLQHSQSSRGTKEPTDINLLADEYLRLSYHGFRSKDNSFNAAINTDFDTGIGKINLVPQDIGRVLLNLYNNAFYAASLAPPTGGGFKDPHYKHEPTVWVSTKKTNDKILISVRDNGPGISQKIIDKIFQPFFTTKPTGQGTGLGLSLSYDIIKAHGGSLEVKSEEGAGSEFRIIIALS